MPSGPLGLAIIGGPNGCGKSTLARQLSGTEFVFDAKPINPDDLTKEAATEFPLLVGQGADLAGVERAEKAVWRAIARGESVAVETVLSSGKYLDPVDAAKQRGYQTRLHFVTLPTVDLALARIKVRVAKGEHDVPEAKVRSRWAKAHDNLFKYIAHVHQVVIFANLDDGPVIAAYAEGGVIRFRRKRDLLPEIAKRVPQ